MSDIQEAGSLKVPEPGTADWVAVERQTSERPPEPPPSGPRVWLRENLFSSIGSTFLTVAITLLALAFVRGLIGFIFDEERRWNAIGTNARFFMTQAYPQDQYIRVWVSLGIVMTLIGLTAAFWRSDAPVTVRKIARTIAGFGVFLLISGVIGPHVPSGFRVAILVLGAILLIGGIGTDQALGDRAKSMTVPMLGLILAGMVLIVLAIWTIPFGKHLFVDGAPQSSPGTASISTKVPWTVMLGLVVVSYFIGRAASSVVRPKAVRPFIVLAWLLSIPVIAFAVLRDPAFDYGEILGRDLPLGLAFAVVGAAVLFFVSQPGVGEKGRLVAAILVVAALAVWALPILFRGRLLLGLLAAMALAAPTFGGEQKARQRYLAIWVATVAIALYLVAIMDTPSTLDSLQARSPFGGFLLTVLIALSTIVLSFPIGVMFALGRTSKMPIFRMLSTLYIEFVRGVPFITILLFFTILFPLFLPPGVEINQLAGALIGFVMFSAAYTAENVRGGLQSIRKGQSEAAMALGMTTAQMTSLIILPQALKAVIPTLVGSTIATFKETSLLAIIGIFDFLYIGNTAVPGQTAFLGVKKEGLLFVAAVYWVFTWSFSKYSQRMEKRLGLGTR